MYHDFFGLKEAAFSIAVNPRYLYMSNQHREALAHLLYGIQNGGFVMLTGEVGTGKTTIIRCLLEQLPENTDIAIILNPMASAPELLCTICDELGASYIDDDVGIKELTDALNDFLLKNHRKGRRTVLLIDEAQLLDVPVLEQIRLLTNLETTTDKLLQIILVGQPELKTLLARPELRQLSQRITARFHLEALTLAETQAYIAHRLSIAGMPEHLRPFDEDMIKRIHHFSGGIPRLINVLCERLLLGAYAKGVHRIDNDIFHQALAEVSDTSAQASAPATTFPWRNYIHAALVGVVLVAIFLVWLWVPTASVPHEPGLAKGRILDRANTLEGTTNSATSTSAQPGTAGQPEDAGKQGALAFAVRDINVAQQALIDYLGLETKDPGKTQDPGKTKDSRNICGALTSARCEKTQVTSWDEIKDINRPALLTLDTPNKKWAYVVLIGLNENHVRLLADGQQHTLAWAELARLWNGDLLYIWSRPEGFERALEMGDQGDAVTWLAEQFARLDKQPAPLTRHFFTDKLKQRVELFQASQNIVPDGIVGAQTLRCLNEALGIDKVLMDIDEPPASNAVSGVESGAGSDADLHRVGR